MSNDIDRTGLRKDFWQRFSLEQMHRHEWEALCDGCGRCCLLKLEDDDGAVRYTNIACRLFDDATCRCGNYALRKQLVKTCVILRPDNIEEIVDWMPATCAYRLLSEGKPLPEWHPLVSGDPNSVDEAGISMRNKTLAEFDIEEEDWGDHTIKGML